MIWNLTHTLNIFQEETFRNCVQTEIARYQKVIIDAVRDGYDGSDNAAYIKRWRFTGAFLYSLTVITTIGESSELLSQYALFENEGLLSSHRINKYRDQRMYIKLE